jgi:hypothetical protein
MREDIIELTKILAKALDLDSPKDSITIGTPGKGGEVKIILDFGKNYEENLTRVNNAFALRTYAQTKMLEGQSVGQV